MAIDGAKSASDEYESALGEPTILPLLFLAMSGFRVAVGSEGEKEGGGLLRIGGGHPVRVA